MFINKFKEVESGHLSKFRSAGRLHCGLDASLEKIDVFPICLLSDIVVGLLLDELRIMVIILPVFKY